MSHESCTTWLQKLNENLIFLWPDKPMVSPCTVNILFWRERMALSHPENLSEKGRPIIDNYLAVYSHHWSLHNTWNPKGRHAACRANMSLCISQGWRQQCTTRWVRRIVHYEQTKNTRKTYTITKLTLKQDQFKLHRK